VTLTTLPIEAPAGSDDADEERIHFVVKRSKGDHVFRLGARLVGLITLALMGLIAVYLVQKSLPALRAAGWKFLTEQRWDPRSGHFGIASVLVGTVMIAVVALAIAVPLAIGASLFITDYAPRPLRRPLTLLVDLLAAVPSLIYGMWGRYYLQQPLIGLERWLANNMGWFPLFHVPRQGFTASTFIAGVVVSLMCLPICTAVVREVFSQAPPGEKEGALALGGTRWGMIRTVTIPYGKGGIVGGSMLALGRALGETIAVALIISPRFIPTAHILQSGGISFASLIVLRFGEANSFELSALMAAGLALFVITLTVNAIASVIVSRSRSGQGTEI
jgi:phosphate transport system permease protein